MTYDWKNDKRKLIYDILHIVDVFNSIPIMRIDNKELQKNIENRVLIKLKESLKGLSVDTICQDISNDIIDTLKRKNINSVYDYTENKHIINVIVSDTKQKKKLNDNCFNLINRLITSYGYTMDVNDINEIDYNIIRLLYIKPLLSELLREYKDIYNTYFLNLKDACFKLEKADCNSIVWFFMPSYVKSDAKEAFNYLCDIMNSELPHKISDILHKCQNIRDIQKSEIIENFKREPNKYNKDIKKRVDEIKKEISKEYVSNNLFLNRVSKMEQKNKVPSNIQNIKGSAQYLSETTLQKILKINLKLDGLKCILRPYQEQGVKFAVHQRNVLIGDEMGLGKTIQSIAVMEHIKNDNVEPCFYLVVCPTSVIYNWNLEIKRQSDLNSYLFYGDEKEKNYWNWCVNSGVLITNFEGTRNFVDRVLPNMKLIVVDEAHYIKNPSAQRTINTKRLFERSEKLLFLTGTALENNVFEMIRLLDMLNPNYVNPFKNDKNINKNITVYFRRKIAPIYLRRLRSDVIEELPELVINNEWCEMTNIEKRHYEDSILKGNYMYTRRVSWMLENIQDSSKYIKLCEIIKQSKEENRKVLIFSFFLDVLTAIENAFSDICIGKITGSVGSSERLKIIEDFKQSEGGSILLSQITAGGIGLNIQAASVVVLCEPQYKPSTENQAISRAYRIGQTRDVIVHKLLTCNSIESRVMDILDRKQQEFNAFAEQSETEKVFKEIEVDSKTIKALMEEEKYRIEQERKL